MFHAHQFHENLAVALSLDPTGGETQCSRLLPEHHWILLCIFISFAPSFPDCTMGLREDQGDPTLGNASGRNPTPPLHPSPTPTTASSELSWEQDRSLCPCPSALGPSSAPNIPLQKKTTKPRADATITFHIHLSGCQAPGLGAAASLPHLEYPCIPWEIKVVNGSH